MENLRICTDNGDLQKGAVERKIRGDHIKDFNKDLHVIPFLCNFFILHGIITYNKNQERSSGIEWITKVSYPLSHRVRNNLVKGCLRLPL